MQDTKCGDSLEWNSNLESCLKYLRVIHQGKMSYFLRLTCPTLRSFLRLLAAIYIFSGCTHDLSREPAWKKFTGKKYIVVHPIFFTKTSNGYSIDPPGAGSYIPISIEDSYSRPNEWWLTEAYGKKYPRYQGPNADHALILGVIEEGTILQVTKITLRKGGFMGWQVNMLARVCDPRFSGYEADLGMVIDNLFGPEAYPEPDTRYIKELDAGP